MGLIMLIIFLVSSCLIGILLALLISKFINWIINREEDRNSSEEINVKEKWSLAGVQEN
jgi:hypothetical protein